MAPNNTDNDELRRRESAKAQEANNNTDSSRNDADDGEEGGQAGQKVVNYELLFYCRKISFMSCQLLLKYLRNSTHISFLETSIPKINWLHRYLYYLAPWLPIV